LGQRFGRSTASDWLGAAKPSPTSATASLKPTGRSSRHGSDGKAGMVSRRNDHGAPPGHDGTRSSSYLAPSFHPPELPDGKRMQQDRARDGERGNQHDWVGTRQRRRDIQTEYLQRPRCAERAQHDRNREIQQPEDIPGHRGASSSLGSGCKQQCDRQRSDTREHIADPGRPDENARCGSVGPIDNKNSAENSIDLQGNQPGCWRGIQECRDRFRPQQHKESDDHRRKNRDRQPRQAHHSRDRLKGTVKRQVPDDREPQREGDGDAEPDEGALARRELCPRQTQPQACQDREMNPQPRDDRRNPCRCETRKNQVYPDPEPRERTTPRALTA